MPLVREVQGELREVRHLVAQVLALVEEAVLESDHEESSDDEGNEGSKPEG